MEGFLPFSRASFILDFVSIAMIVILPVLTWSLWTVKQKKNYPLHGKIQLITGSILLVAVLIFEIDIRINGWRHLAEDSYFYDSFVFPVLYVHLFFAISTTLLWMATIFGALKHFSRPPHPSPYSSRHRRLGKLAALGMYSTAITGWGFYALAFVF